MSDVYDLIPDLTGVAEEDYDSYDLARLKETLRSADPDRLEAMAVTWGEVSGRLDDIGTAVRARAMDAHNAWRGTPSSVSFQQKLRMEHGSARSLADTARQMETTVSRLAEVAREMREYEKQLPMTEDQAATAEQLDTGGGIVGGLRDLVTGDGFSDTKREMSTFVARIQLREFHERYQQILREDAPNRIAVDIPTVNVPGSVEYTPTDLPPHPGSPGAGGYAPAGGYADGTGWRPGSNNGQATSLSSGGDFWPAPQPADASLTDPGGAEVDDDDDLSAFDAGGSRSWEVDDSFRGPDGTTLAGFHTGSSGVSGGSGGFSSGSFSGGSGGSGWTGSGSGFGSGGGTPGAGSGGGPSGGYAGGAPGSRSVTGFGGGSGASPGAVGRGMMPPPMTGPAGGQQKDEERERQSWMAEESNVWGLDDDVVPPVIGAPEPEDEGRPPRRRRPDR